MAFSAEFLALLQKAIAPRHYLAEVKGFNRDTQAEETLRFSTVRYNTSSGKVGPGSARYRNVLQTPGAFSRSLYTPDGAMGGVVLPDLGVLEALNPTGELDFLRRYDFDGREFRILMGGSDRSHGPLPERPWTYDRFQEVLKGISRGKLLSRDRITFPLSDQRARLETDLLTSFYTGMGACVRFNGTSQAVNFGNIHNFGSTQSFTIEWRFWMAPTLWQSHVHCGKKSATGTSAGWLAYMTTASLNVLNVNLADGTNQVTVTSGSTVRLIDDAWHDAALVVDRDLQLATLYIDGVAGTPVSIASIGNLTNAGDMTAGRNGGSTVWGELLGFDDFRVWTVARAAKEIDDNRRRTLQGTETGLANYWKFDESTSTTAGSAVAGGNSGTLSASTLWNATYEGFSDVAGQARPMVQGPAQNVEGVLIDPQRLIWQFHGGRVKKITNVYWGGVLKTIATDYTVDLLSGTITCVSSPAGKVTADVEGEAFGGYITTAPDIARRVATKYRPLLGDYLSFSNTYVDYGDNFDQTGSFTFEAWILPLDISTAFQQIVSKRNAGSTSGWALSVGSAGVGTLRFATNGVSTSNLDTPTGTLRVGRWQHVAAVLSSATGTKTIYVDGVQAATLGSLTGSVANITDAFQIGAHTSNGAAVRFMGPIDEPRLWSTARTQAEIEALRCVQAVGNESGLVFADSFNVGTGTVTAPTAGGVNGTVTMGSGAWVTSADSTLPVDAASFAALKTLQPAEVAHVWKRQTTRLAATAEVLASISAFMTVTRGGLLYVGRIDRPLAARLGAAAVRFAGKTALLNVPHTASLGTGANWSWEAWVYPLHTRGAQYLMRKKVAAAYGSILRINDGGTLTLAPYNSSGTEGALATTLTKLKAGRWYHVAAQGRDSGFTELFIDGALSASAVMASGFGGLSSTAPLEIGGHASGLYGFTGVMDEVRHWSWPRLQAAIAKRKGMEIPAGARAEEGQGATLSQVVGYWRLNAGSGSTAADELGTSPGTLTTAVSWVSHDFVIRPQDVIDLQPKPVQIPTLRQAVGYSVNWTVQTGNEISSSVTAIRRAFLAEERRFTSATDSASIVRAHPLSRAGAAIAANFVRQADADAEMDRLQDLWGSDLEGYDVTVQAIGFRVELGKTLLLQHDRLDMTDGAPVIVLGARDDPNSGQSILEVMRAAA
jgi:hypothetical protein